MKFLIQRRLTLNPIAVGVGESSEDRISNRRQSRGKLDATV